MRVTHNATCAVAVQLLHDGAIIGAITGSELLFEAKLTLATGDIECCNDTVTWFDCSHAAANLLDNSRTFVAQDLVCLELHDLAMKEVQVRSTNCKVC